MDRARRLSGAKPSTSSATQGVETSFTAAGNPNENVSKESLNVMESNKTKISSSIEKTRQNDSSDSLQQQQQQQVNRSNPTTPMNGLQQSGESVSIIKKGSFSSLSFDNGNEYSTPNTSLTKKPSLLHLSQTKSPSINSPSYTRSPTLQQQQIKKKDREEYLLRRTLQKSQTKENAEKSEINPPVPTNTTIAAANSTAKSHHNVTDSRVSGFSELGSINHPASSIKSYTSATSSPQTTSDAVLIARKQLEAKLDKLRQDGRYLEAEQVYQSLINLKVQEQVAKSEIDKKNELTAKLANEENHLIEFEKFCETWDNKMREYEKSCEQALVSLQQKHEKRLVEFHQAEDEHRKISYKPSKKILELRQTEKALANQNAFREAHNVKLKADQLDIDDRNRHDLACRKETFLRECNLKDNLKNELDILIAKNELGRKSLLAEREIETSTLLQKYKNASHDIERTGFTRQSSIDRRIKLIHNIASPMSKPLSSSMQDEFSVIGSGIYSSPLERRRFNQSTDLDVSQRHNKEEF